MSRMGFGEDRFIVRRNIGRKGYMWVAGQHCYCESLAEGIWLAEMRPIVEAGAVTLEWQVRDWRIHYQYKGDATGVTYRPDAVVKWHETGETWVVEIKRRALYQKDRMKIKYLCQQYPDLSVVLAWVGSLPKKGPAFRQIESLRPHLHHIWQVKAPKHFEFDEDCGVKP
jgi:hypothetical protein